MTPILKHEATTALASKISFGAHILEDQNCRRGYGGILTELQ